MLNPKGSPVKPDQKMISLFSHIEINCLPMATDKTVRRRREVSDSGFHAEQDEQGYGAAIDNGCRADGPGAGVRGHAV